MLTSEDPVQTPEQKTPSVSPGTYSPVTVTVRDTIGALFLGILAAILLVGWMRSEKRYLELKSQMEAGHGDRSIRTR